MLVLLSYYHIRIVNTPLCIMRYQLKMAMLVACLMATVVILTKFLHPSSLVPLFSTSDQSLLCIRPADFTSQSDLTFTNNYSIEMMIRMASSRTLVEQLYCTMLRSAALFWSPKFGNITLILDEESKADHVFAAQLQKQQQSLDFVINLVYEPMPKDPSCLKKGGGRFTVGYNRQLWSSFFMDLYTDADVIAWTDTDAMFSTPVTPENIFNGSKLRVIGVPISTGSHKSWDQATRVALGKNMLASFMVYFPTNIWRDTFNNCRNHILKHLKVSSFDEAFKKFHKPSKLISGTVSIILTYAYYFERDRYDWHLDVKNDLTLFNTKFVEAGFEVQPADTLPDLHVTVHQRYYDDQLRPNNPLKQGYCVAQHAVGKLPRRCEEFQNTTNFQLFEFEVNKRWRTDHLDTWCGSKNDRKRCVELIEKHYQNVRKYYEQGLYDLDLRKVAAVELAAAKANIKCPSIFDFS